MKSAARPAVHRPGTAPPTAAGGDPPGAPRLTTTVPREYVHRPALSEVFLTDCSRIAGNRFSLTGQWPRAHAYFSPTAHRHDLLQAAETMRQAGLFLAHTEFRVPLGHRFTPWDVSFTVSPGRLAIGSVPTEVDLDVVCSDLVGQGEEVLEAVLEFTLRREGEPAATGYLRFATAPSLPAAGTPDMPAAPWAVSAAPPPALFGRTSPHDVVLVEAAAGTWRLLPDPAHPVLSDDGGPVAHLVALEAARQATHAMFTPGRSDLLITGITCSFVRQPDPLRPCWIDATVLPVPGSGPLTARVTARQDGRVVWESHVHGDITPGCW
ncbi:ScbA/BarX family gamma-butyrolactone biosynthesis protein [Streptomyces griseofuscus]|uniref:ScbA/BarX family gamma-butyrolactone biosynthesis protein n=1 Tax=Streptomyces griseofuscus TaxID=146922 RepID=UPI0036B327F1